MFSSDELADPERAFFRLLFAAQDMGECAGAIGFLLERHDVPGDVGRALETGAVVAYARPWTKGSIGRLGDHWRPSDPEQRALHELLLTDRNKVYAHTDEEVGARWVAGIQRKPTSFLPAWRPSSLEHLPEIAELAAQQRDRFAEGIAELARRA